MEPTTKPAKNEPNPVRDELAETDWAETETERVTRDLERTTIQDKDNNVPEGNQPDTDTTTDTGEDVPDASLGKANKLLDVEQEIKILEGKPDELISGHTWDDLGLSPKLREAVRGVMNFTAPSKIQGLAIPCINKGGNFIGQAQSGTGKTAAFSLGVLQRVDPSKRGTQAIILSPTRELARQNYSVISKLADPCGISVSLVVKEEDDKGKPLNTSVDLSATVLVCTPGKAREFINKRKINVRNLTIFVLDEADEMLNLQGLYEQTNEIHSKLPKACQICLFSATYNDKVAQMAKKFVPDPKTSIYVPPDKLTVEKLFQFFIRYNDQTMKFRILSTIYTTFAIGQSIIFCQKRETAKALYDQMKRDSFEVSLLYGKDMKGTERDRVMDSFRSGEARVLITTNVLARGIDVLQVSLVINYDLPVLQNGKADCETYLHRVGRSARYGNSGIALNFVGNNHDLQVIDTFEKTFNPNPQKGALIREVKEDQLFELEELLAKLF